MALPVLYSFRRCPYAMRARLAITASRQVCELREVVLKNKPAEMLAISPKATVPVLQLVTGDVLDESLDIMYWALQQADPESWLDADQELTQSLIKENDHSFKRWLDRYKYFDRFPEMTQAEYWEKACQFLAKLEDQLNKHQQIGLCAPRLTLADYAIFPFVRQFAHVDMNAFLKSDFPSVIAWEQTLEKSDRFQACMKKYPAWEADAEPVCFPESA